MKKFFIILLFLLSFTQSFAQTYFFIEEQNYIRDGKVTPTGFMWLNKYFQKSNMGIFAFALASSSWGELYAGPTYTFQGKNSQNFIEGGIGIGIEDHINPLRSAGYVFFNFNPDSTGKRNERKWQGLLNAEYGGSGYWYLGFITYGISNKLALGVHAQSFTGVWGPRFQFQTGGLMIYAVAGRNLENKENGGLIGIRHYF